MPIYEYVCQDCSEEFSLFKSVNSDDRDLECPKCGSTNIKKKISAFSCCAVGGSSFGSFGGFGGG
jgi:putative FmdB family regulatory protein